MGRSIAIFDDDKDILYLCALVFQNMGFDVKTFNSCENLLENLSKDKPSVILMDNWIPNDGGIAATQLIKKSDQFKDIPVIYFSANKNVANLAKIAGAEDFIQKPFNLNALEEKVLQWSPINN